MVAAVVVAVFFGRRQAGRADGTVPQVRGTRGGREGKKVGREGQRRDGKNRVAGKFAVAAAVTLGGHVRCVKRSGGGVGQGAVRVRALDGCLHHVRGRSVAGQCRERLLRRRGLRAHPCAGRPRAVKRFLVDLAKELLKGRGVEAFFGAGRLVLRCVALRGGGTNRPYNR